MREITKKLTVISILSLFLVSGFAGASFASIKDNPSDDSVNTKTVTLYRYGPDGAEKSMLINLDLRNGKNFEDAISEKCREMLGDTSFYQCSFLGNNSNVSVSAFSRITSFGKGTHLKSPFSIRIPFLVLLRYGLLQKLPLRYRILGPRWIPIVIGNYSQDENARTDIKTVPTPIRPNAKQITILGKQIVLVYGFVGYTGWRGTSADFYEKTGRATGFDGYGSYIFCAKFQ